MTVGDLCFVALGQIVNRHFNATRYQPTGGLVVSSPTYSEALRKVILQDWKGLTPAAHKRLLIEDFLKPDHDSRREGAYLRLSLYCPGTVEKLVLDELSKPTFDVFVIEEFCRETLYRAGNAEARKSAYDEFIRKHGQVFAAGVQEQLFDDLDSRDRFASGPQELLTQLFGWPANVKPEDRPVARNVSESERARFIATLTHDTSQKVGDLVKSQFIQNAEDDYFAPACLRCLANRGYPDFLPRSARRESRRCARSYWRFLR